MTDGAMAAFTTSTVLVAVAEIGDKTQLLSFALAARYRNRMPIIWGILVARWSTMRWQALWAYWRHRR
jgi:putative Ca2+/H+ antiporter (TMEM165/GDT1 family)